MGVGSIGRLLPRRLRTSSSKSPTITAICRVPRWMWVAQVRASPSSVVLRSNSSMDMLTACRGARRSWPRIARKMSRERLT
ncbi:hypothetical protein D9M71_756980 [compost metagenome]